MKKRKAKGKKTKRVTVIFRPEGIKAFTKKAFAKSFRSEFTAQRAIQGLKKVGFEKYYKRKSKGFRFSIDLKKMQ